MVRQRDRQADQQKTTMTYNKYTLPKGNSNSKIYLTKQPVSSAGRLVPELETMLCILYHQENSVTVTSG